MRLRNIVFGLVFLAGTTASAQRVLTLTAPVGGENWFSGDHNVTWLHTGTEWQPADTIRVEHRFSRSA